MLHFNNLSMKNLRNKIQKTIFFTLLFPIFAVCLSAQQPYDQNQNSPQERRWVDSVFNSLSFDERLGQLVFIRAHSDLGEDHIASVENLIKTYKVGGMCFFQGTPEKQVELTNRYQLLTKIPLMVTIDGEWGVSMRLKQATIAFPKQLMLGAIQDNRLIYKFGQQVAYECRRLGIHANFAPDIDVNNNPRNPVINDRSFGEDKYNVAVKGFMYMRGMQDAGVLACAKHFPGHGDTETDSHYDLPLIKHDMKRLQDLEMYPFRVLSQYGVGSMMAAHLNIPAIDTTLHLPTSLSPNAIKILRKDMGFDGIIFTDGLEMKGVTKYFNGGEVEARSIAAGNDVLLLPENIPNAFEKIKLYLKENKIDSNELYKSVKRVLTSKYRLGLTTPQYVEPLNVRSDLNTAAANDLKRDLISNALTLVRNEDKAVPTRNMNPNDMLVVSIGATDITPFQVAFGKFSTAVQLNAEKTLFEPTQTYLKERLKDKSTVIISLHDLYPKADKDFGLNKNIKNFVNELAKTKRVILVFFGNPYGLQYFDNVKNVLLAYNEDPMTQQQAAAAVFGAIQTRGKLPVTVSPRTKAGMGELTMNEQFLDFDAAPESVGFNAEKLRKIDAIAQELIEKGAAPGCQILVAKNGKVVYNKAFGHHTYEKMQTVTTQDLYDMASITKVAATTVSLMRLADDGKFDVYKHYGDYLPTAKGTNKENVLLRDVLIHQAGLKAWIPFYKNTIDTNTKTVLPKWYVNKKENVFDLGVTERLFLRHDYKDSIVGAILQSNLEDTKYRYSDLGMILMSEVIKNISGKTLDEYSENNFYRPLGMTATLFNPLSKFPASQVAPTEDDHYFRNQQIRGTVHDMAAAMLGGVSGHAGLFSTSHDLAILFQMLLNGGEYGGVRYLKEETVKTWTTRQNGSTRRGLGWDMKELDNKKTENMSALASENTFGHTGFTGNAAYADPDKKLIYIFLSNRTYPTMENNKIIDGNYRPRIQTAIYEALK
ncbi:MAG: hypothetical protein RL757_928 [Bacteroidota bacterium]|jgi:beta-glucosidase-like glycosyl hydrolase/CubicO group peptidase (beta-lactamase class C family)